MIAKSLAAFLFLALPLQAKTSIETAYESGELDLATALIYQVQSLRAPMRSSHSACERNGSARSPRA